MMTYAEVRGDRRKLLALTGLTPPEFEHLLVGFARSYARRYPSDQTAAGRPRQRRRGGGRKGANRRSEEHTSELQSHVNLVCRLLLEKKKKNMRIRRL